jgi:hypothetical protein
VIITAARSNEVSIELPDLGHGPLHLLPDRGAQGRRRPQSRRDRQPSGAVRVRPAAGGPESRAVGANMHPLLKGELGGRAAAHQSARAVGGRRSPGGWGRGGGCGVAASCSSGRWDSWRACSSPAASRSATSRAGRCARSICSDAAGDAHAGRRRAGRGGLGRVREAWAAASRSRASIWPASSAGWPRAAPPWSGSTSRSPRRPSPRRRRGARRRPSASFGDDGVSRVVLLGPLSSGRWPLSARGARWRRPHRVSVGPRGRRRGHPANRALLPPARRPTEPTLALALVCTPPRLDGRASTTAACTAAPWDCRSRAGRPWPISYVGPAGCFLTIPSDAVAALGDAGSERRRRQPVARADRARGRHVPRGTRHRTRRRTGRCPGSRSTPTSRTCCLRALHPALELVRELARQRGGLAGRRRGAADAAPALGTLVCVGGAL